MARIVVYIEGGMVSHAESDDAELEMVVIDKDIAAIAPRDVSIELDGERCCATDYDIYYNPDFVKEVFEKVEANG